MNDLPSNAPVRPWRVIAQELANEHDHKRISELSDELNRALQHYGVGASPDGDGRDGS